MKYISCRRPFVWLITCLLTAVFGRFSAVDAQQLGESKSGVIGIGESRGGVKTMTETRLTPAKAYATVTPAPKSGIHAITLKNYDSDLGRAVRDTESIVIPELQFHQTELDAAFELLHEVGVRSRSPESGEILKPINVILKLSDSDKKLVVTFTARDINLFQAIKSLTHLTGLSYRFVGNVIVIEPYKEEGSVAIVTPLEKHQGDITRARMSAVILPEISYRSVPLVQVVEDLRENSAPDSTAATNGPSKKANIILRHNGVVENQTVTFHAQNISLFEALKTICSTFDLKYTVRANVVIVEAKPVAAEKK